MFLAFVLGEFITVYNMAGILWLLPIILFILKIITKQQVAVFVMIFLGCVMGVLLTSHEIEERDKAYRFVEQQIRITGRVSKILKTQYGVSLYLDCVEIKGNVYRHVIIYTDEIHGVKIGNIVQVNGELKQFSAARNKGNFDSKKYYMTLGVYIAVNATEIEIIDSAYDFIRQQLYELKNSITDKLDVICNSNKGILKALNNKGIIYQGILLGDKSEMSAELKELYSLSGISHVLAISGLHISIIGMFLYNLFRRRFSFGVSMAVSVTAVVMFGILSGLGIAAVRALVMFGLKMFSEVLGRSYDYITSISLAGILLLIGNPFVLWNSGFQMSFAAIISIVIVWKKIVYIFQLDESEEEESFVKKTGKKLRNAILCSLTVSICMNPMIAYHFFSLPTYSFLLNVVIIPLMSVVVTSGVAGILVSFIGAGVAKIAILPGCYVLDFYEKLCNVVLKLPFSNVIVGKSSLYIVCFYYIVITALIYYLEKRRKKYQLEREKKLIEIPKKGMEICEYMAKQKSTKGKREFSILFGTVVLLMNLLIYCYYPAKKFFIESEVLEISTLDVGQGDGIVIRMTNDIVVTIDGGSTNVKKAGQNRIIPFLKAECISEIDYAVMTHADTDHISGLIEMLKQSDHYGVKVRNLVLPDIVGKDDAYKQMVLIAEEHGVKVLYIKKGDFMRFGKVELKCIHPCDETKADNRNGYSTVLGLKYNKFSMLFTGDISSEQERELRTSLDYGYIVLKVAHHGSKYSTSDEFLQWTKPKYSMISVGEKNMYGHPSDETLKRLKQSGSQIFRTDENGCITVSSDGETIGIERVIE